MPEFSTDAYANAPGTLDVCNIKNPKKGVVQDGNGTNNDIASEYNRVYFGKMPTSAEDNGILKRTDGTTTTGIYSGTTDKKQPIYWRVLNTTANDKYGTPALFMLTEYSILKKMAWDNTEPYGNQWTKDANETDNNATTDSAIKILLQGLSDTNVYNGDVYYDENDNVKTPRSVYEDCFETIEQNAILKPTATALWCIMTTVARMMCMKMSRRGIFFGKKLLNRCWIRGNIVREEIV